MPVDLDSIVERAAARARREGQLPSEPERSPQPATPAPEWLDLEVVHVMARAHLILRQRARARDAAEMRSRMTSALERTAPVLGVLLDALEEQGALRAPTEQPRDEVSVDSLTLRIARDPPLSAAERELVRARLSDCVPPLPAPRKPWWKFWP